MGSFFTNVQVYAGNLSMEESRINVINAIRTWVLNNNFAGI